MCPQHRLGQVPGNCGQMSSAGQVTLGDGGRFVGTLAVLIGNSAGPRLAALWAEETSWRGTGEMRLGFSPRRAQGVCGHTHAFPWAPTGMGTGDRLGEGLAKTTQNLRLPCPGLTWFRGFQTKTGDPCQGLEGVGLAACSQPLPV